MEWSSATNLVALWVGSRERVLFSFVLTRRYRFLPESWLLLPFSGDTVIPSISPLQILSSQEEWYKAELRSHEGYVPKNFIDFHVPP